MADAQRDSQQHQASIPEVGEDAAAAATSVTPSPPPPAMTEEERQELQEELVKVEDEIQTLSQVLAAKEKQVAELKRKLGLTPLTELKQNISKTWQEVTTSIAYKKTSETLSQAGLKATAAFSNMGSAISRKLEDVRNAQTFKSFEEKVENLKIKRNTPSSIGDPAERDSLTPPVSETLTPQPAESPTRIL